jgi:hypothetical protein
MSRRTAQSTWPPASGSSSFATKPRLYRPTDADIVAALPHQLAHEPLAPSRASLQAAVRRCSPLQDDGNSESCAPDQHALNGRPWTNGASASPKMRVRPALSCTFKSPARRPPVLRVSTKSQQIAPWPGRGAGTLKARPDVGDRANLLKHLSSGNVQRTLRRLSEPNSPPGSRARHRLYDERFDGVGWATSGMADDEQEHED